MVHHASEADARRNGEVAMLYRARPLVQERNTMAQQAGSPTGREAVFPRCSPLPQPLRDLPPALESPHLYNGETQRAFRDQAAKRPADRQRPACEQMALLRKETLPFN